MNKVVSNIPQNCSLLVVQQKIITNIKERTTSNSSSMLVINCMEAQAIQVSTKFLHTYLQISRQHYLIILIIFLLCVAATISPEHFQPHVDLYPDFQEAAEAYKAGTEPFLHYNKVFMQNFNNLHLNYIFLHISTILISNYSFKLKFQQNIYKEILRKNQ